MPSYGVAPVFSLEASASRVRLDKYAGDQQHDLPSTLRAGRKSQRENPATHSVRVCSMLPFAGNVSHLPRVVVECDVRAG